MRGKIEVASELNKGTTFTIKIPVTGEYRLSLVTLNDEQMENPGTYAAGN